MGKLSAQGESDVTAAGGDVEHDLRVKLADCGNESPAPPNVHAAAQQPIGKIVAVRNARKHGIDRS